MTLLTDVPGAASAAARRRVAAQAIGATKTYGKGDGAVVALDRVDVEFTAGAFTVIVALASIAGVLAAVGPARRAAKLDILAAIASH
jgi:ABC-type antimicrobial peptide transport system permease subunit